MKRLILGIFLGLSCVGCDPYQTLFKQYQELSKNIQWDKSDPKTFSIEITDNSEPLEFVLAFRYATGYLYDKVIIRMTETTPMGKTTFRDLEIPVRDAKGEWIGEKGFDIIDLEYVIDKEKKYPQHGTYTYTLEQAVPGVDALHYAMEVGLILRKEKQK